MKNKILNVAGLFTKTKFDARVIGIENETWNVSDFVKDTNLDRKISAGVENLATKSDITTPLDFAMANKKLTDDLNYLLGKITLFMIVFKIIWFSIHCSKH